MRYSYRKGSSQLPNSANKRSQLIKVLYWAEILMLVVNGRVVVNVKESSFNRSVKNNYSWLSKRVNITILNDSTLGKTILILVERSTDEWIPVKMICTVNSLKFCVFLKLFEFIQSEYLDESLGLPIILLDNAKFIHQNLQESNQAITIRGEIPYSIAQKLSRFQAFEKVKSKLRSLEEPQLLILNRKMESIRYLNWWEK